MGTLTDVSDRMRNCDLEEISHTYMSTPYNQQIGAPSNYAGRLAQYAFRRSMIEAERTYTLYPDRLTVEGEGLPPQVYELSQVRRVHLKYERTKQRAYYQCFIHTDKGRVDLRHVHWQGLANFEDRRGTYTPFVRTLLHTLARYPGIRFDAGSMANFIAAIIGIPLMGILTLLALLVGLLLPALVGLGITVLCILMLRRSRPRRVDPAAPPADLLPA